MDRYYLDAPKIKSILKERGHGQEWLGLRAKISYSWLQRGLRASKASPLGESHVQALAAALLLEDWKQIVVRKAPERRQKVTGSRADRHEDLHDAITELRTELRREGAPRVLYAALYDGSFLTPILRELEGTVPNAKRRLTPSNLSRIEVRIINDTVLRALDGCGLIEDHLPAALKRNLKQLEDLYRIPAGVAPASIIATTELAKVSVQVETWPGLPLMWGFLIGDLLVYGRWRTDSSGRYIAASTTYVARRNGRGHCDFEYWSQILRNGTSLSDPAAPLGDTKPVPRAARGATQSSRASKQVVKVEFPKKAQQLLKLKKRK